MIIAKNAGGEAQSMADFAVFEPTPDTMVEVHKTLVYDNKADKKNAHVSKFYPLLCHGLLYTLKICHINFEFLNFISII